MAPPSQGFFDVFTRHGTELPSGISLKTISPSSVGWDIIQEHDRVVEGKFGSHGPYQDDPGRFVTRLVLGRVTKEHPVRETPIRAKTFIS